MHGILVILIIAILHFVYTLSRPNPFSRYLIKPKYQVHYSKEFIGTVGWMETATIEFTNNATHDTVRTAVYDCRYSNPKVTCLKFINFPIGFYPYGQLSDFRFFCIDLSSIDCSDNKINRTAFIFVNDEFQCSRLVLPKDIDRVDIVNHCPELETLVIPSNRFVPVYWASLPYRDPVLVYPDFHIEVPKHLLDVYRSDPNWNEIIFSDQYGNEFHPRFEAIIR